MTYKQKICKQIIRKMEWWRNASWANHIDTRTKDDVITVMENVVDGIAYTRQSYMKQEDGKIYRKGASLVDQCAHRLMEYKIIPDWNASTVIGDYIAYYHEERLYTVRHLKKGITCLVYAKSADDAVAKVRTMEAQK